MVNKYTCTCLQQKIIAKKFHNHSWREQKMQHAYMPHELILSITKFINAIVANPDTS